jgi:cobalt-zinc-cadmium efflux system membrane fusion protein
MPHSATAHPTPVPLAPAHPPRTAEDVPDGRRWFGSALLVVFALAALLFFLVFVFEVPIPGLNGHAEARTTAPAPALGVELVEGEANALQVPEGVQKSLGIRNGKEERVAVARVPTRTRPLVLPGSTALDPTRLTRIRARFAPAEVVEIARVRDPELPGRSGKSEFRELRSGDTVKKGDLLGVFYSVDVGSKKNDLIDALVQLKLDAQILERAEKQAHAVPEVFLLNARRAVEGDRNAISRAVNTLKTWNIPEEDIKAVEKEAAEILKRKGKRDKSKDSLWPRVELRSPGDGVVVERNVSLHEMVVDNTVNLFQIAKVDRLLVVANAPEDDLPTLLKLPTSMRYWTVRTMTNGAPSQEGIRGPIDDISYVIDVNQHTAVVKGYIDNPGKALRGGQFISATIDLPPPEDVVEVPMNAIVDDGHQCVVFVQPDPARPRYVLRRVEVTHRFEKTAFVRSRLTAKEQELTAEDRELKLLPRSPLLPGERVLTSGVLELKKELEDRQSRAAQ